MTVCLFITETILSRTTRFNIDSDEYDKYVDGSVSLVEIDLPPFAVLSEEVTPPA